MHFTFLDKTSAFTIALVLFLLMVMLTWCGNYFAAYRARKNPELVKEGLGALEGALLGLVALILAFTFSMAASRYDSRRQAVVEEANVIGTAILRADLYPDSIRDEFRKDFKEYVEARIAYIEAGADTIKIVEAYNRGNEIASKLWKRTATLAKDPQFFVSTTQMVPALNAMIDIITTRLAVGLAKVPSSIVWLLFLLCLVVSFVVGYGRRGKHMDWVMVIGFSLMTSLAIYLIFDLDRPRRGTITMDSANQRILDLREMFDE
jgi:hypothetical protein